MELKNIKSSKLLPRFASEIEYLLNAFDSIIIDIWGRSISIDAPLTMEAVEALSDDELQALYSQYGLAEYYPDISRSRRNWMLYQMARIWRYLGTPHAVETLCKYIFGNIEIDIKVHDNGAFDNNGNLIDESKLDTFDVEVLPTTPDLPETATRRIIDNIINFSRNSQAFNELYYTFETELSISSAIGLPYDGICGVMYYPNYTICEDDPTPPTPPTPTVSFDYAGNFTLNETIESDTVDGGFGVLSKALSGKTPNDLTGWSVGGNLNLAFFTSAGIEATSDFTIPDDDTGPLYNSYGNPIPYYKSDDQFEVLGAWRSDGSIWTVEELAYISSLYEDETPPTLHWASDYNLIDNPTIFCLMYQKTQS